MLLLKIHWPRVITWPFLSEEAWQGRVPMCAGRQEDKGDWTPDISSIPHFQANAQQEQWLEFIMTKSPLFWRGESEQVTWVLKFSTFSKSPLTIWQLPHMWAESRLLFPLFSGTQHRAAPSAPCTHSHPPLQWPHHLLRPRSRSRLLMPGTALTCVSAASTLLNLPEPRDIGRCCIFPGYYLFLVLFGSQTLSLSPLELFSFKTPQRIGSSIGNEIENHSELLFCVFSSLVIYYSVWVFVRVWGWGAVSFPAGNSSLKDPRILVTQQVLSTFVASLHSFHPNEI